MEETQKLADLHIHSNYSFDGSLSPTQIEQSALRRGVEWISFADHNTPQASIDLWTEKGEDLRSPYITLDSGIKVVSGIEVTCKVMSVANLKGNASKIHLLVYGADLSPDSPIVRLMEIKRQNDLDYDLRRLRYLISLKPDISISTEEIQQWFVKNGVEGEPSNEQIMKFLDDKRIDLGITSERKLVAMLERMPPVERLNLDAEKVIRVGHASGGVVLMAHPSQNLRRTANKRALLSILLSSGLDGFETLYNGANPDASKLIESCVASYSKKRSMIYSGGSDTHNLAEGNTIGKWNKRHNITVDEIDSIINKVESMQAAYEKGQRDNLKPDATVDRYIDQCATKVAGTSIIPKGKPKKNNKKKKYRSYYSEDDFYI